MNCAIDMNISKTTAILKNAGLSSPLRLTRLIRQAIDFLELDLSGRTVLTEAASGPYVVTPVIASLAGAKNVIGLTRDSAYATATEVKLQTTALACLCGCTKPIKIYTDRSPALLADADIVTNLGFVRPLDAQAVSQMRTGAVIALMCESWEFRPGDVDLDACRRKGIAVVGTNEDFPGLEVFAYSGVLTMRMLFEAGVEVYKSGIVIVSSDKFGRVIRDRLSQSGANVVLVNNLKGPDAHSALKDADAIVVLLPHGHAPADISCRLTEHGIASTIGTWHIPMTRYYREKYGYRAGDFPNTDNVYSRALSYLFFLA
jgi:hypothetical protein